MIIVISDLEKVRVKHITPTAQMLQENLLTENSEMAALRMGLEGVAVLHDLP